MKKILNNQGNREKHWQAGLLNAKWQKMFTQDFVPGKKNVIRVLTTQHNVQFVNILKYGEIEQKPCRRSKAWHSAFKVQVNVISNEEEAKGTFI